MAARGEEVVLLVVVVVVVVVVAVVFLAVLAAFPPAFLAFPPIPPAGITTPSPTMASTKICADHLKSLPICTDPSHVKDLNDGPA